MKIEKVEITPQEYRITIVIPAIDIRTSLGYDMPHFFREARAEQIIEGIAHYLERERQAKAEAERERSQVAPK